MKYPTHNNGCGPRGIMLPPNTEHEIVIYRLGVRVKAPQNRVLASDIGLLSALRHPLHPETHHTDNKIV
jgi:hypothetical protein